MSKPTCYSTKAFATTSPTSPLGATTIERRVPTATDVQIQILYCGVCHSDLHFARDEWHFTQYPAVPGHEIVGRVSAASSSPAARVRTAAPAWSSFATTAWS